MPNYHNFNPWRQAADNIASGMVAVQRAKNRQAMWEQEQAAQAPLIAARTQAMQAEADSTVFDLNDRKRKASLLDNLTVQFQNEVVPTPDGGVQITPKGAQIAAQIMSTQSKGGNDFASGLFNLTKAGNFRAEQAAGRKSREDMNAADNAAAAARPVELSQNTRLVDPKTGAPIASGNVVLSQGASLFQPGADSVTLSGNPAATGVAPRTTTPRADAIQLQIRADEIKQLNAAILKSTDANEKAIMMRRRNQLMRDLGVPEGGNTPPATNPPAPANLPLTDSTVPAQGGNTPAAAPAVGERVAGQVYQLPKGAFKWTGTGWVPAQ